MGELERNMRDDVGQHQGNAPSTDNGGQMDMFEDERERTSLHRRGAIARGVAKRGLVAFLAFAMAFGTTPAQLWAEGAEGIAEAVAQTAPPAENGSGESAASPAVDLNASDGVANGGAAEQDAAATASGPTGKTEDDGAAGNEAPAASTSDASKQDAAVVSAAGEAKAQPAKAESQDVSATCSVVGTDAKGAQQTWAAAQQIALKEGSTAADLSEQLFKQAGLTTDYDPNGTWGWALNSITSPFDSGRTLAYDPATGAYWQLFVNGSASAVGAGGYTLKDGDSVVWCYSKYGDPAPVAQVSATCSVVGTDAKGAQQTWAAAQQIALKEGSTAADLSEQLFKQAGLTTDYDPNGTWGWALNSITSPFDSGRTLAYDPATGAYWQLFVNGSASAVGAGGYTLKDGDSVVWCYSKYGDPAPANQISVSCTVIGQDASGAQQTWAQPTTALVEEGATAADLSEQAFKKAGIGAKTGKGTYGWYLESLTSPFNKTVTLSSEKVNENTWKFWQFFVNGQAANVGAGNYVLKAGDKVTWVYGFDGTMPGQVSVSMEIIGKKDEKAQRWTDPSTQVFVEGTTIKDASAAYFDATGIESKMYDQFGYWGVHSLVSPLDGTELSGAWSFFVNGVPGPQLDSDYVLKSGDKIVWAYAPGDTVPNPDEVVVDPSASRPTDWKADWSGNSNAVVKNVSTPTGALASSWTFDWKAYSGATYPNASEPIVVNGNVYLAVNKRLLKIDAESGKVLAESNLKTAIGYTTRPIYTKGLVIVPLDGGAVQALTADTLTTVWVTDPVSKSAQSNSQLTVDGNYLYVGTVDVDYGTSTYNNGHLTRINILTGAVSWQHVNADEGYYWTSATVGDGYILVPTSAGTVEMLSKSTGDVLGSVSVGAIVNSGCVLSKDGKHAYVISRDGKLHVLALSDAKARANASSRISEERVIDLGLTGCACMPTLYGN